MGFIERATGALDWFGRGQIVYQVLIGLGLGAGLRAVLKMYTHINPLWITPIWLLTAAGVVALLVAGSKRLRKHLIHQGGQNQNIIANPSAADKGGIQLQIIESFYRGQEGPLLQEVQDSIREELERRKIGNEREVLLIRYLATVLVLGFFEATWYAIFGSQIRALEFLNKGLAKVEGLMPFYNHDLDKRPQYTFEA